MKKLLITFLTLGFCCLVSAQSLFNEQLDNLFFAKGISTFTHTYFSYVGFGHLSDEDRRKKITQTILDNMINEKYEDVRKDFHISLKQSLPTEKIAEAWKQWLGVYGPFVKVLSVAVSTDKGYNQIRMRCQFKNDNGTLEVTFSEEDKVIGLFIKP